MPHSINERFEGGVSLLPRRELLSRVEVSNVGHRMDKLSLVFLVAFTQTAGQGN